MKIRDGFATINGDSTVHEFLSDCIEIIADDGRELLSIKLEESGAIYVSCNIVCKHNGVLLDSRPLIKPQAANCFYVIREPYGD